MTKLIAPIIFTLLSATIFFQTDSTSVSFVAYWDIRDSYDFKISKLKQSWKNDVQTSDEEQSYIANFTVIDSTENSYTINWSFENDLVNTYNIPDELMEKFEAYSLTEIQYQTSELGDFIEILNWKEVSETMNNMFNDMIEVLSENDPEKQKVLAQGLAPFKQIYSSKQGIEELVVKELQYFHFPMGVEFDITEPIFYDEELANMFGGNPIKADAKLYFENVDFEEGFCILKQEMKLNETDTKALLLQVFKQMNIKEDDMDNVLQNAVFKIEDFNVYEYYYNPGIPHKIETNRTSTFNLNNENGKRIEKVVIELIYYD